MTEQRPPRRSIALRDWFGDAQSRIARLANSPVTSTRSMWRGGFTLGMLMVRRGARTARRMALPRTVTVPRARLSLRRPLLPPSQVTPRFTIEQPVTLEPPQERGPAPELPAAELPTVALPTTEPSATGIGAPTASLGEPTPPLPASDRGSRSLAPRLAAPLRRLLRLPDIRPAPAAPSGERPPREQQPAVERTIDEGEGQPAIATPEALLDLTTPSVPETVAQQPSSVPADTRTPPDDEPAPLPAPQLRRVTRAVARLVTRIAQTPAGWRDTPSPWPTRSASP